MQMLVRSRAFWIWQFHGQSRKILYKPSSTIKSGEYEYFNQHTLQTFKGQRGPFITFPQHVFSTNFRVRLQLAALFNGLKNDAFLGSHFISSSHGPRTILQQRLPQTKASHSKQSKHVKKKNDAIWGHQVSGPQTLTKHRHKAGMKRGGAGCRGQESNNQHGFGQIRGFRDEEPIPRHSWENTSRHSFEELGGARSSQHR